jgi:hypothetical protein
MRTKNSKSMTSAERAHLLAVKGLPCSICNAEPPSSAHHIKQGHHFTTVALCADCHTGYNGWHGTKALWRIAKMDELSALSVTIERLYART